MKCMNFVSRSTDSAFDVFTAGSCRASNRTFVIARISGFLITEPLKINQLLQNYLILIQYDA